MASRRTSTVPTSFKTTQGDPKSSKSASKGNSGTGRKTGKTNSTVVKSRYLLAAEKASTSKSNSQTESIYGSLQPSSPNSTGVKPKVLTPQRRSMTPQVHATSMMPRGLNPSILGTSVLQSTFADGHCFHPDLDFSIIGDKTVTENVSEAEREADLEMEPFLLAYLTAKMENNTIKLKSEAEEKILQAMAEQEKLHNEVMEKKRRYLLAEKKKMLNELLDLQIETLTPVAEAARQFTEDYKCFAAAVDTTRHDLPVKNLYINGDGKDFLDKAGAFLKKTEELLLDCTQGDYKDNTSLECLKNIKITSKDISQQLSGTVLELQELSSLACRHSVNVQLALEEEQLGSKRTRELFISKLL